MNEPLNIDTISNKQKTPTSFGLKSYRDIVYEDKTDSPGLVRGKDSVEPTNTEINDNFHNENEMKQCEGTDLILTTASIDDLDFHNGNEEDGDEISEASMNRDHATDN
eukprot:CAMPEP_0170900940 /NCGR_PEP_ID=MMETSP0734-20130129/47920_1 /TAXON_ID=186038 /ORGANISM="Fragilariopsis kerguelensis, Strain L26-C5" /LENGTH=107 /DNA_ID=CAMNT_0011294931 /DNA_START=154 /DNA_END=477 /DNA_ORIENTATION=-